MSDAPEDDGRTVSDAPEDDGRTVSNAPEDDGRTVSNAPDHAQAAGRGPAWGDLERRLGHVFREPQLLATALSHASHAYETDGTRGNERLEFLGDAVLDVVVSELLYRAHPGWGEGDLTRARAALVNSGALARRARELELGAHVRLGATERRGGGVEKDSILANVFEALVGALYLDGGLEAARRFAEPGFAADVARGREIAAPDPKTAFQEWAHALGLASPRYRASGDTGVEGADDRFTVEVLVEGTVHGTGVGRTKRAAEREAARRALAAVSAGVAGV